MLSLSLALLQAPTGIPAPGGPVRREIGVAGGPDADEPVRREFETGSRLSKRAVVNVWDADKTRKVQAEYGECVVKKQPAAAREFVITPWFESGALRRILPKVGDSWCLLTASASFGSEMRFPGDTMRYALADALVRREFAGASPSLKDAGPIVQPVLDESEYAPRPGRKAKQSELKELAENRQKRVATIYVAHFGECVVRADPANSYALLMSDAETPKEDVALKGLMPAFDGCLAAGQDLSFNKSTLRGTIAMNYYRLAHAPRAASPQVAAQGTAK
ncbi:hypothetical protein [Sphingomonas sp.]|uniref:hypothetical protein n=1 Tax=Sphingomonas sp. TaxID=28214 RepID=UPI0025E6333D|nr:hypothetical protein [Sphingomonas sp.]